MERCKENDCFVGLQKGKLISGGENLYLSAKVTAADSERTDFLSGVKKPEAQNQIFFTFPFLVCVVVYFCKCVTFVVCLVFALEVVVCIIVRLLCMIRTLM